MPERDIEAAAMTMDVSLGERTHRCGYLGPWHGIATQRTAAHTMPLSANTHHDRPEQSLDSQMGWLNGLAIESLLIYTGRRTAVSEASVWLTGARMLARRLSATV